MTAEDGDGLVGGDQASGQFLSAELVVRHLEGLALVERDGQGHLGLVSGQADRGGERDLGLILGGHDPHRIARHGQIGIGVDQVAGAQSRDGQRHHGISRSTGLIQEPIDRDRRLGREVDAFGLDGFVGGDQRAQGQRQAHLLIGRDGKGCRDIQAGNRQAAAGGSL